MQEQSIGIVEIQHRIFKKNIVAPRLTGNAPNKFFFDVYQLHKVAMYKS